jgi:RNA-directed DNA polymerase
MPSAPIFFCWHFANALLEGGWAPGSLIDRGHAYLGERPPWLVRLVGRILTNFPDVDARLEVDTLARFIYHDRGFSRATERVFRTTPRMAASPWAVPALPSSGALADWLGLSLGELDWFADCQ